MGNNIDLDKVALDIARKHLLEKMSFQELGKLYFASPSTIQRRLMKWLEDNRFELIDKLGGKKPVIISRDDRLGEELVRKTGIWRARVLRIAGLEDNESDGNDDLQRCLGEAAAELVMNSLRKSMTIGIGSGRGAGFTVDGMKAIADKTPSWASGYESIRLVSLCGGAHLGGWQHSSPNRDFDADENVFMLSSTLKVPRQNVYFMSGPISSETGNHISKVDPKFGLDIAIIGVSQLDARHPYFSDYNDMQLKTLSEPMRKITEWQAANPARTDNVAEIVLRLYPSMNVELPGELLDIIDKTNRSVLAINADKIRNAGELVLVAGGRQKTNVLHGILTGTYTDNPLERKNLTLVTDAETAEAILKK